MEVVVTRVAFKTFSILKSYMRLHLDEGELTALTRQLLKESSAAISTIPARPVCPELASIGIFDYLQLNILKNYKVIYKLDNAQNKAFIVAFMRQKQSAQKLLVDLALIS